MSKTSYHILGCTLMLAGLTACATTGGPHTAAIHDVDPTLSAAARSLIAGDMDKAVLGFGDAAARNPSDANRQTLLALASQQAAGGDPGALDVATAGYDLAMRASRNAYWAAVLAGKAAHDRGRYTQAQSYFARAVLMRPDDHRALLSLAISAYLAGDPQLAALSAGRAAQSGDADVRKDALKVSALASAATGHDGEARTHMAELQTLAPFEAPALLTRINELIRTGGTEPMPASVPEAAPVAPDQVSVDVAIILSQTSQRDSIGLNLLEGLQAQYGFREETVDTGGGNISRTVTQAITLPQLTYNLNLFNRFGQSYQVVARPMLSAYRNEPAEFFVGRSAKVAVTGVNFSQLESIDIGTGVKVTPLEITPQRSKLKIEVTRSFLSGEPAGNFNESVNTWRQTVSTTVEVDFGKTLILSGLSESVRDSSATKTPVIGNAPIVGSLFNRRVTTDKRDAVLILVTPSAVTSIDARPWARPADVERLIGLWHTVVAPGSDAATITQQLEHARLFTRGRRDDVRLNWPSLPRDQGEIVKDLLVP
jgi:tetratricopeptide (TPR) repeat protein